MFLLLLVQDVGLSVKVREEVDEEHGVRQEESCEEFVGFATEADHDYHVQDNGEELDELDACHVLFPPQIFAVLWAKGGHQVVEIHENVH